jgi:endonuclease G
VGAVTAPAEALRTPPPVQSRSLTRSAEAIRIDTDYASRGGYDSAFIPGVSIPLPELTPGLAQQLAPLRAGEPLAGEGELKYEHFSIKLHKTRRMAVFTATNIDGATYLTVDRDTGRVVNESEGETWFKDPRVSASFFLDQSFYSEWSIYFDRGHLTRRTDPTWGDAQTAERANADTYHFTNCSPQHFRFNQSAKFWQGAERYVLEKGLLIDPQPARLCVFQGPIFNGAIDRSAGDVQIPSSFFKVIAWKAQGALKAVGLVVDQLPLLDETRVNLGKPRDAPVNVAQWRVPITSIGQRTGLKFPKPVRDADTIGTGPTPVVGEAQILIKSFDDLLA